MKIHVESNNGESLRRNQEQKYMPGTFFIKRECLKTAGFHVTHRANPNMLYHAWCGLVLCAKNLCVGLIKIYRNYLSPVKLSTCRFMPTCSAYMQEAIEKKGVCKGTAIGIKRILRCHPFGSNGYDPVNK